jgi:hypothetical protein
MSTAPRYCEVAQKGEASTESLRTEIRTVDEKNSTRLSRRHHYAFLGGPSVSSLLVPYGCMRTGYTTEDQSYEFTSVDYHVRLSVSRLYIPV